MELNSPIVLVGGGLSGLITAKMLLKEGREFTGLEKTGELGGRARFGQLRFNHGLRWNTSKRLSSNFRGRSWKNLPPKDEKENGTQSKRPTTRKMSRGNTSEPILSTTIRVESAPSKNGVKRSRHAFRLRSDVEKIVAAEKTLKIADRKRVEIRDAFVVRFRAGAFQSVGRRKGLPREGTFETKRNSGRNRRGVGTLAANLSLPKYRFLSVPPPKTNACGRWACRKNNATSLKWVLYLDEEIANDREEIAKCMQSCQSAKFRKNSPKRRKPSNRNA